MGLYGVTLMCSFVVTRCVYAHTSGLLIKGVWMNDLVDFVMTLMGLRGSGGQGCPEEQEFENLQKQSKMTKTSYRANVPTSSYQPTPLHCAPDGA